jgi:hypothetical protein
MNGIPQKVVPEIPEGPSRRPKTGLPSTARRRAYRIELRGQVDEAWVAAFDPTSYSSSDGVTSFEVQADQAALRGILNRLWDLNLDILSVIEVARSTVRNGGN